ncbi:voltage-gated potassium channel [Cystobasidium minutum MCA 4210]|uniref:voltage-gated potassium channel n=1 Tax=Cystobasidium minutum MCA 4210 TaxID=1397322 RepID=UPI0034CD313A|eukprot:jgi/Rhomi1/59539/CE59538_1499
MDSTDIRDAVDKVDEAGRIQRVIQKHILAQYRHSLSWSSIREHLIAGTPLFAALVAPVSTLYDIPALTQRWYSLNGQGLPDPTPNLALSALGLAFNAIANGLLVYRFSARREWWKAAMILSTVCWIIKSIIATVNLAVYGHAYEGLPGYTYTSAFWCGVISCILAGVIASTLVLYVIVAGIEHRTDSEETRIQGRHFMLGELGLFCFLAFEALVFSKIEGWTFFDGIYFSLVVSLTIGYGDFAPTHASPKALLFPFAIITVAFLASQVSMIVQFFSQQTEARRTKWRQIYELKREQEATGIFNADEELVEEINFLKRLADQEDRLSRVYDLTLSLLGFVSFWMIGAAAYEAIEGWSFGNSVYYCYVTFFTIGFGDFSPTTAGGQAFFIIYALIAVPLIASFAVQTVTSIWTAYQNRRLEKDKVRRGVEPGLKRSTTVTVNLNDVDYEVHPFISHADLVMKYHEESGRKYKSSESMDGMQESDDVCRPGRNRVGHGDGKPLDNDDAHAPYLQQETLLLDDLLEQVLDMENRARRLLISSFDYGSKPRLLLQADKNLMNRAQKLLGKEGKGEEITEALTDFEEIHLYRMAFARFLVCGSKLKQLQGEDQLMFERRRGDPYIDGSPVKLERKTQ